MVSILCFQTVVPIGIICLEQNGAGVAVMYTKNVEMFRSNFKNNWGSASYGVSPEYTDKIYRTSLKKIQPLSIWRDVTELK